MFIKGFSLEKKFYEHRKVFPDEPVELNVKNYTATSGSTIITLNKDYVSTLKVGTYTLKVTYTNGTSVETTFKVEASTNTKVDTGDNTQVTLWLSLLGLSAMIGLGYVVLSKKKRIV